MAEMTWTLLSIFVIAPLGALALDKPLFGNWIWHIDPENGGTMSEPPAHRQDRHQRSSRAIVAADEPSGTSKRSMNGM
jgi:hypothetical protein